MTWLIADDADEARIALDDTVRSVTYGELRELLAAEMRWLTTDGGECYALLADNGCGWALADLALFELRRLHVPLPAYFTSQQRRHVLDDAGIDRVLTDQPEAIEALGLGFHRLGVSSRSGLALLGRPIPSGRRPLAPAGTVKVTYTSGSTGAPKGVCLGAGSISQVVESLVAATASLALQRHLVLLPLATLLENIAGLYAPLRIGATCLLPSTARTGLSYGGIDAQRLLGCVTQLQPESLVIVPELLRLMVGAAQQGWTPPASLKFIAVGGAAVPEPLLMRAAALKLPVFEGYGLSECASVVCLNTPAANRPGSVGRVLPHARLRIDAGGQIRVQGATLLGYLGDSAATSASTEVETGDLGEIDVDGYVHIRGRARNMFITSLGRNISPEWIERELLQSAGVAHALAWGEAQPHAVALLSPLRHDVPDVELERAVQSANLRLPDYARVGAWVRAPEPFSIANQLLTANGRLRRAQILRRHGHLLDALYEPYVRAAGGAHHGH